ncbi:MAG: NAD(P)-dependent oxidoreductase [Candidatus Omnitrophica bacterium]|nr:NAD(P)-dependent oxidoreductase [Candidatus Omnitrophota bacterium]
MFKKVAITGGAGYVGSALVPHLLQEGYDVTVMDLYLYGRHVFKGVEHADRLHEVEVDIRDETAVARHLAGVDAVIHLACVSNDPSFELNPALGRSINYDAFRGLLRAVSSHRIKRFIYASSSSVYGVKEERDVHEDMTCEPLTDYSKYKLLCEDLLKQGRWRDMEWVILRPATVCGWAPRLRLDLTVNTLTIHALVRKKITVFGGSQLRPNIHIQDMAAAYGLLLEAPREAVKGETFNIGTQNCSVSEIADIVRSEIGDGSVTIVTEPTEDLRSYHINSDRIRRTLGFKPRWTIQDAVRSLVEAYRAGKVHDPLNNISYYNIKTMQALKLEEGLYV